MGRLLDTGCEADPNFAHHFHSALEFFSKDYLLGEVGTFLLDRAGGEEISPFRWKHKYFMQVLNDFNIIDLLYANGAREMVQDPVPPRYGGF